MYRFFLYEKKIFLYIKYYNVVIVFLIYVIVFKLCILIFICVNYIYFFFKILNMLDIVIIFFYKM